MKSFTTTVLTAAVLCSVGLGACNTAGSGNSGSATAAKGKEEASAKTGTTTTPHAVASKVSGPGSKIGQVTTVSGVTLPEGYSTDYSSGAYVAPVFSWKNSNGESGALADYRGKVVMLNFWGTWCGPCKRELPDIVRLRDNLAPKGFEVIGVAVGERPPQGLSVEEHLANFAGTNDLRYPLIVGNQEMVEHYGGIPAVPTTFIINKEGKIVNMLVGGMTEDRFRQAVEAAM